MYQMQNKNSNFQNKYYKYKAKYLALKNIQSGGSKNVKLNYLPGYKTI